MAGNVIPSIEGVKLCLSNHFSVDIVVYPFVSPFLFNFSRAPSVKTSDEQF